ncbi:hypothetical protein UNDYM_3435 [Undibacterium sp. YM2]|uniref:calcium-binding protein n=1 Tax=Undibacterium sp. YM2 TaxID=2058625 RepID=UPI001331DC16|nr:calcium-binding protein [Undibacterium sp. YM2]BBB67688.1 hypothetical protein UNDYM_3435 [Undibacterium sp. YM2]
MHRVGRLLNSKDPEVVEKASEWMERVPGTLDFPALWKITTTFGELGLQFLKNRVDEIVTLAEYGLDVIAGNDPPKVYINGDWKTTKYSNGAQISESLIGSPDGIDVKWITPRSDGGTDEGEHNWSTGEQTIYHWADKSSGSIDLLSKTVIGPVSSNTYNETTTSTDKISGSYIENIKLKSASYHILLEERNTITAKDGSSVVTIETSSNFSKAKYDENNSKIEGSWLHKDTGEHGGYQRDLITGAETTVVLDKNNVVTSKIVENKDGTGEIMTYNPDTGSRSVTTVNADKSKTENSVDPMGSTFFKVYDPKGNLIDSSWKKWDGTEGREVTNPNDGSVVAKYKDRDGNVTDVSDDKAGNRQEIYYDKNGVQTGEKWAKSDGSQSESKIVEGVKTTVYKDGKGVEQTSVRGVDGITTTSWLKPDGSKGNIIESADGSLSGMTILADGSKQVFNKDADGATDTTFYTNWGQKTARTWKDPDGSYGKETFDGRKYTSITVNADKSTRSVSDDGKGNITVINRDSQNNPRELFWSQADGSYGFEKTDVNKVSTGVEYRVDGNHVRYVNDKINGASTSVIYDKKGNFVSSSYKKPDGTTGGVYISDGKRDDGTIDERSVGNIIEFSTGGPNSAEKQNVTTYQKNGMITNSTVYANGTHKNYSDDGNGTRTETVFGEGGVGIVSNTTIKYNADGSGTATTTTVNGTTEKTFGPGGIAILSKPDMRPDTLPPADKSDGELATSAWDPSVSTGIAADNLPKEKPENGGPNIPAEVKPGTSDSTGSGSGPKPGTETGGSNPGKVIHIETRIINPGTGKHFNDAIKWQRRRDPLTIDLNGNGLDTTGVSLTNPILFDHDGDGIKTGTGWILPDDGFLALDRNDNGTIDTGAELFGDSTPLYGGGKAQDGFAALADQDSNHDGKVDKLDANWDKLRVWRDLNQDGVSQKNELFTLDQVGISSFSVAKTANSVFLANGNQIADLGSYTRADGTRGTVGEAGQVADVNLAEDTFNSKFTDHITLVAGVELLPDMQGSGQVRSLREAASIDSAAGRALKAKLTEFVNAKTHTAQRALLEDLIMAWGATSNMATSIKASHDTGTGALTAVEQFAQDQPGVFKRIDTLEKFNGSNFLTRRIVTETNATHTINLESDRLAVLDLSWTTLSESVYSNLLLQTRFQSLFSQLDLTVDNASVRLNGAKAKAYFEQVTSGGSIDGLADLIEFNKYVAPQLTSVDWDGRILMAQLIQSMPLTPALRALYAEQGIIIDPSKPGYMIGTVLNDILVASTTSENIAGNDGDDMLFGGDSYDTLDGGAGNDFLSGGAGDDVLIGGTGNDIYLWGKGSGNDQLVNNDTSSGRMDVIQIKADTKPDEIIVRNDGFSLTLKIKGTTDTLRVVMAFDMDGVNALQMVNEIRFADGTVWDAKKIEEESLRPTDGDDELRGFNKGETINGGAGNDYIMGWGGNDFLYGGEGNDRLEGGEGDDTIDGGLGDDMYIGYSGNDTFIWGKGSGHDVIADIYGRNYGGTDFQGTDIIKIKAGTKPEDVRVARSWGVYAAGNDLSLVIPGDSDLRLENIVIMNDPSVNKVVFEDGTVWDITKLKELSVLGDETSQKIAGFSDRDDVIHGKNGHDTIYGADGEDILYGDDGDDWLYGDNGNDTLLGGDGFDRLFGGDGDDFLDSGISLGSFSGGIRFYGGAELTGGKGDDTYVWGEGYGNIFIDNTTTKKEAGEKADFDRLLIKALPSEIIIKFQYGAGFYIYLKNSPVDANGGRPDSIYINAQIANGQIVDTTLDQVQFSDGTIWDSAKLKQMVLEGTELDDDIQGYFTNDLIHGNAGVDNIVADKGNDTVFGGSGGDYIHGGEGNDLLYGDEGDDDIGGGVGDDTLYGGDGNDVLSGGEGDDVLDGGAGDDNLGGPQGHDTILWGRGAGRDTAFAVDPAQSADDTISLIIKSGVKPSDISFSRDSRDLFIHIKGTNDELRIREFFVSGHRFDGIRFDDDSSIKWTQQQILEMQSLNHAPRINARLATIEAKETLELNYAVVDNAFIDEDPGDSLTYSATFNKGEPLPVWLKFDPKTRVFSGIPPDMSAGLYAVQLIATDSFGASTTIDMYLSIDSLAPRATEGNDKLIGSKDNDLITGLGGHDTLDGGLGADTLIGGTGYDVYIVDNVGDVVIETTSAYEVDQIYSSVTYTLPDNVEELYLTGSNAINGTGNALSNGIWGNDADNVLDGGDGDDLLVGGGGNDTLYGNEADHLEGGDGDDTYIISAYKNRSVNVQIKDTVGNTEIRLGEGFTKDTLNLGDPGNKSDILLQSGTNTIRIVYGKILGVDNISRITFANGDYLDKAAIANLMTGGSLDGTNGNDNLKAPDTGARIHGYAGDDVITGGAGADIFWGDDGEDTLIGGSGDDKLYGGDYDDRLIGGEGNNVLSGEGDNDTLIDGSGSSILLGGYGDDTYQGGAGDDQLFDQYGSDTYIFNLGDGKDTIADGTYEEHDSRSSDRIRFGQGINAKDVHLSLAANGTDLIIKYSDHDQITILGGANGAIETYEFADGTVMSHQALLRGLGAGGFCLVVQVKMSIKSILVVVL